MSHLYTLSNSLNPSVPRPSTRACLSSFSESVTRCIQNPLHGVFRIRYTVYSRVDSEKSRSSDVSLSAA
jgi:hypothetical protein